MKGQSHDAITTDGLFARGHSQERRPPLGSVTSRMDASPAAPPPGTDKSHFVREMFARIAPRYDATNKVISAGMDEGWRRRTIALLQPPRDGRIVDLCCGTGDIVFHLVRTDPTLRVTGVDFCEPMLEGARARAVRQA